MFNLDYISTEKFLFIKRNTCFYMGKSEQTVRTSLGYCTTIYNFIFSKTQIKLKIHSFDTNLNLSWIHRITRLVTDIPD